MTFNANAGKVLRGVLASFPDLESIDRSVPDQIYQTGAARKVNDPLSVWLSDLAVHELAPYWNENFEVEHWRFHFADFMSKNNWTVEDEVAWSQLMQQRPRHWIDNVIGTRSLRMVYQPIVEWVQHELVLYGHELLARADLADGKSIAPDRLFKVARSAGRLYQLDRLCRTEALRASQLCPDGTKVFINFVPSSIYSPTDFLRTTITEAKRFDLNPSRIVFEVVETEPLEDSARLLSLLDLCREHGFSYALDDVGQGANTIERLRQLRPDFVKLDRMYVSGIEAEPQKQEIAKRIAYEASLIDAVCIAEGIERIEEGQYLRKIGYSIQQGYFYGQPEATPIREPRYSTR